jgi:aspartate racemase
MKTVGIIGGLGPETTAEFYLDIVFSCQKKDKTARPAIIISSVPLPYQIEEDAIAKNIGIERIRPFLIKEAERLEKAGADFIVMPCNSLHIFIDVIRKAVNVPVLSILEETAEYLKLQQIHEVGIIATSTTLKGKLYEQWLAKADIQQITPDDFQQAKIGKVINNLVLSRHNNSDREEIQGIIDDYAQKGVRTVILACTDLQLLIPQHDSVKIYDTMKIYSEATVNYLLK